MTNQSQCAYNAYPFRTNVPVPHKWNIFDLRCDKTFQHPPLLLIVENKLLLPVVIQNQNEFAVLVTENESEKLMKYGGPFLGAIQNRNVKQAVVQAEPRRNSNPLKIEYGQEL